MTETQRDENDVVTAERRAWTGDEITIDESGTEVRRVDNKDGE